MNRQELTQVWSAADVIEAVNALAGHVGLVGEAVAL